MGTYGNVGEKFKGCTSLLSALEDFGANIVEATEIEWIDLERFKENTCNMPMSFFILNLNIDRALENMRCRFPERVPPFKEYKIKEK